MMRSRIFKVLGGSASSR